MYRHDTACVHFDCHAPGLLRIAMRFDPWIIGPDRHDRTLDLTAFKSHPVAELPKTTDVSRVTAKHDCMALAMFIGLFYQVRIVTAPVLLIARSAGIPRHPPTGVFGLDGLNSGFGNCNIFVPV